MNYGEAIFNKTGKTKEEIGYMSAEELYHLICIIQDEAFSSGMHSAYEYARKK